MSTSTRSRERATDGPRQALVDAAMRVIARDGVKAATTRKIADEAGLPLGTVHYWFSGKSELLEEVVSSVLDKLIAAIETTRAQRDEAPTDLLEALRAAWKATAEEDPGAQLALYELTAMSLRTPGMGDLARRQYGAYRDTGRRIAVEWIAATGAQVPGGADALGQLLSVTFDGLGLAWLADPDGTDADQVFQLFNYLLQLAVPATE